MPDKIDAANFWKHMDDVTAGMLTVGDARPVPMSPYADERSDALWFITAKGTDLDAALRGGAAPAQFIVSSGSAQLYANTEGAARISEDRGKLDEIAKAQVSDDQPDVGAHGRLRFVA